MINYATFVVMTNCNNYTLCLRTVDSDRFLINTARLSRYSDKRCFYPENRIIILVIQCLV